MTSTVANDLDVLARTIYGEARGESWQGKVAVAYTIVNRAAHPSWWGKDVASVCLKPFQYSCWLASDPNFHLIQTVDLTSHAFRDCYAAACLVYNRTLSDPTLGSTHYYALSIPSPPAWAATLKATTVIGGHKFYTELPATTSA